MEKRKASPRFEPINFDITLRVTKWRPLEYRSALAHQNRPFLRMARRQGHFLCLRALEAQPTAATTPSAVFASSAAASTSSAAASISAASACTSSAAASTSLTTTSDGGSVHAPVPSVGAQPVAHVDASDSDDDNVPLSARLKVHRAADALIGLEEQTLGRKRSGAPSPVRLQPGNAGTTKKQCVWEEPKMYRWSPRDLDLATYG
jgi:hypothetical protein